MADNNKTIDNINLRLTDFDNIPEGFQFYEWASRINGVGSKTDSSDTRSDFQKIAESINTLGSNVNDINSKLGTFSTLKFEKVTTLPDTTNADSNKIYLVPAENSEDTNVYDEYIFVDDSFELVGTTAIDFDKIKVQYVTEDELDEYEPEDIEDGVIYLVEETQTETVSIPPTDDNESEYGQAYYQFTKENKGNFVSTEFSFNNMAPLEKHYGTSSYWPVGVASVSGKQSTTETYNGTWLNGYSVIDFSGENVYSGQITLKFARYNQYTDIRVSYFLYNKSGVIYKSNITSAINQRYDESTLYNKYSISSSTGVYSVGSSVTQSAPLTINIPFNYEDRLVVVVRRGIINGIYNSYTTSTGSSNHNLFCYKVFLSDLTKEVEYNTYSPSVHLNNRWYDMVADSTAIDSLIKDFKKELEESYYNKDDIDETVGEIYDEIDSVALKAQSPIVEAIYVNGADLLYNSSITENNPSYIISNMLSTNMIKAINYCLINRGAILNTPGYALSTDQIKYKNIFFNNGIRNKNGETTTSDYASNGSKGYIETNLSINGKTSMYVSYTNESYDGDFVYTIDAGDYILKVELVRYDPSNLNSLTADIGLRVVEIVGQINEIPLPVYQTYLNGINSDYLYVGSGGSQLPAFIFCNENNGIYDLGTLKVNSNVYRSLAMHNGFLKQNRRPIDMSNTFGTMEYFTNNPFDFSLTVANSKVLDESSVAEISMLDAIINTKKFSIKDFEVLDINKFYYLMFISEILGDGGFEDEDSLYDFVNSITDLELKQFMLKYVEFIIYMNSNPDLSEDPTVFLELYEMIVNYMETRCAQYPLVLDSEGNHYILKYDLDIVEDASNVDEIGRIIGTLFQLYQRLDYLDIPIYYKNARLVPYDNSADKIDELGQAIDLIAGEIGVDSILNEDYPQEDAGSMRIRLSDLEFLTAMLVDDATAEDIPDGDTLLPLAKEITNDLSFPLESDDDFDYKDDSGITGDTVLPDDPDVDEITAAISDIFN